MSNRRLAVPGHLLSPPTKVRGTRKAGLAVSIPRVVMTWSDRGVGRRQCGPTAAPPSSVTMPCNEERIQTADN